MGIFHNPPPQPPTGSTASTPPLPHAVAQSQGDQPPRRSIAGFMALVVAAWPVAVEPTIAINNQPVKIAPLTLQYGSQPQPQSALAPYKLVQIAGTWELTWSAQSAPKFIPVTPAVAAYNPYWSLPRSIIASWEPPWTAPPKPVSIAPLTLVYGAQPIPAGPISPIEYRQLVATWEVDWAAQTYGKNAGWNVPPILSAVVYAPLPRLIWTAWEPPYIAPPRPVSIATALLAIGQQPPTQFALSINTLTGIIAQWQQDWKAQIAAPNAGWNVPPILVQVSRTTLPGSILASWEYPWIAPPAPTKVSSLIPVLLVQVPYTTLPRQVLLSWEAPFIYPPRPVDVATRTLPTGVQPPPISPLALSKIIQAVAMWEQKWNAQSAGPNAPWNIPVTSIASVARMTADSVTFNTFSGDSVTVNIMTGDIMQDSD